MEKKEKCPYSKKCGGCTYQGVAYEKQLKEKQELVDKLIGGFCKVSPIVGMSNPYHYRNKVHAAFGITRRGEIISGVYREGTHDIVPVEICQIEDKKADEIIQDIKGMLRSFKIKTYDEDTGYGLLRHVMVRRGFKSGEIMVVLVLGSPIMPSKNNFVKALRKKHPEISTVIVNVNDKRTSMVLGDKESVIYGKGYISDELCGCRFKISSKSFYQVNPVQTEILYNKAIELASLTGKERVLDAYCGIGTIGIIASKKAKEVIGVELNKAAIKDAITNAKINGINNIRFFADDAGQFMLKTSAKMLEDKSAGIDVVFMDPPRAGSDENFMSSVVKLAPRKVVYVSCNPETLARDLKYFTKNGYKVESVVPVDMFPHTGHIETVCLLSKLHEAKHHVNVTLDMDELDITSAESKATYEEIKDYVLEKHGLQVTNLYIAQVKRKCGIIERENYNKPKSEDTKQPQCPEDKEKAIMDALEHFGMI